MVEKEQILNIPISLLNEEETIQALYGFIKDGERGRTLFCANPHSIIESMKDIEFREALNSADILLPDGIGVVLASKILGGNIKKRLSGPDVFFEFTRLVNQKGGYKYFFYGSTNETLKKIELRIKKEFSNIKIAGLYSPPFRENSEEENDEHIQIINKAEADVLWVGMTAPKQEKWIYKNKAKLEVPLIGAIGAAFDFFAEPTKRASTFWQRIGLEWLSRCFNEPWRLGKRNFIAVPKFSFLVFMEILRKIKK
ncbi:MAG: WecB/TagA/CpsF family glycosyltransferase [Nanoarchaeota archaeon]|nr:WecB/TagA/CpsF family glycosyltransferase [Nanoarchaeota archaeon]